MSDIRYGVNDTPSHGLSIALGLQTFALIVTGIVLVPVIVLRAAGGSNELMTWAIFAALFVKAARDGQFDDLDDPPERMLHD